MSLNSWLLTIYKVAYRPGKAFRIMRIPPNNTSLVRNHPSRIYLSTFILLAAIMWAGVAIGMGTDLTKAFTAGAIAGLCMLVLTYIEAYGVAFFSKNKGWRISWATAEWIACYSAIGWLPAITLGALVYPIWQKGMIRNYLTLPAYFKSDLAELLLIAMVTGISIMWFEVLVWVGARNVRFANHL